MNKDNDINAKASNIHQKKSVEKTTFVQKNYFAISRRDVGCGRSREKEVDG